MSHPVRHSAPSGNERVARPGRVALRALLLTATLCACWLRGPQAQQNEAAAPARAPVAPPVAAPPPAAQATPSLDDSRAKLEKWIETQQIMAKERGDWDEGKKILTSRLELTRNEIKELEAKIAEVKAKAGASNAEQAKLVASRTQLEESNQDLARRVSAMEKQLHLIFKRLPEYLKIKLQPLYQRVPQNPAETKISVTERFQNVLGIMNEVNKSNNEIAVINEVHQMSDGKPAEVKTIYVGLGQGYYLSPKGEAAVGRPSDDGWQWNPIPTSAKDLFLTLEIIEGKHVPAFVQLPVKVQ